MYVCMYACMYVSSWVWSLLSASIWNNQTLRQTSHSGTVVCATCSFDRFDETEKVWTAVVSFSGGIEASESCSAPFAVQPEVSSSGGNETIWTCGVLFEGWIPETADDDAGGCNDCAAVCIDYESETVNSCNWRPTSVDGSEMAACISSQCGVFLCCIAGCFWLQATPSEVGIAQAWRYLQSANVHRFVW